MNKSARLLSVLGLSLGVVSCQLTPSFSGAVVAESRPGISTTVATDIQACRSALQEAGDPLDEGLEEGMDGASLSLLIWNVQKAGNAHWREDLSRWSERADVILLQEALAAPTFMEAFASDRSIAFAPGYQRRELQSGVATISGGDSDVQCHLQNREPLLLTPKATVITRFALDESAASLLVVNTHMINFTLGSRAYRRQLADIEAIIEIHEGPVIVAGDFNSWNSRREAVLHSFADRLQLQPASFAEDNRSRFMGYPLDHVFVGDMRVDHAVAPRVTSSDHNPLYVTLSLSSDTSRGSGRL